MFIAVFSNILNIVILMKYGNFRSYFFSTGPTYGRNGLSNEKGYIPFVVSDKKITLNYNVL